MSLSDRIRALAGVTVGRARALPSPPENPYNEVTGGGDPTYANLPDGPDTQAPFHSPIFDVYWKDWVVFGN